MVHLPVVTAEGLSKALFLADCCRAWSESVHVDGARVGASNRVPTAALSQSQPFLLDVNLSLHYYPHITPQPDSWRGRRPDVRDKYPLIGQGRPIPSPGMYMPRRRGPHGLPFVTGGEPRTVAVQTPDFL